MLLLRKRSPFGLGRGSEKMTFKVLLVFNLILRLSVDGTTDGTIVGDLPGELGSKAKNLVVNNWRVISNMAESMNFLKQNVLIQPEKNKSKHFNSVCGKVVRVLKKDIFTAPVVLSLQTMLPLLSDKFSLAVLKDWLPWIVKFFFYNPIWLGREL